MNADDKIRRILEAQVDVIEPSPAGWDRIKDGIAVRRRRRRLWLRSSAAATVALSLVAVVAVNANQDESATRPNRLDIATQPASPDDAAAPTADSLASIAIWPLTTEAEVAAWKRDPSGYEFLGDKGSTALHFARDYLELTEPMLDTSGDRIVVLRRADGAAQPLYVGTLDITGGGERPYLVRSMSASGLSIVSPQATEVLGRVVRAHGNFAGVDQVVDVELRSSPAAGGVVMARTRAEIGAEGWEATLEYVSSGARTGSLLVTTDSGLDGGLAGSVAIPVAFAPDSSPASTAATARSRPDGAYPAQFVAVEGGRIGLFDTKTGKRVRYLTEVVEGRGASDPSVTPDGMSVVYAHGAGTCEGEIRSVPVAGGPTRVLVNSAEDPSSPALSKQNDLAYVDSACSGDRGTRIVVQRNPSPSRNNQRVIEAGDPRSTLLGLSWSADGAVLAAVQVQFAEGGDVSTVRAIDVGTKVVTEGTSLARPTTPEEEPSCGWRDTGPLGATWVATKVCGGGARFQTAYAMDLSNGRQRTITSFEGRHAISLTVTASGDHLLFDTRDPDDKPSVFRFSVDGEPVKVADGLTQPAWVE
ncbi:MAG TPA: hypothetical protein VNA14_01645 [Mycobacteriales bacterium]|nr:hypothetical protein [Mycobacteriales bacterium]